MTKSMPFTITKYRDVWIAWKDTRETGHDKAPLIPVGVCGSPTTAKHISRGHCVTGGEGIVTQGRAYLIDDQWVAPCEIIEPSEEDKRIDAITQRREQVRQKALELGLTEKEIKILCRADCDD